MPKPIVVGTAHPNFAEKTITGGSKTAKFMNVFSLESFPLYSINQEKKRLQTKANSLMRVGGNVAPGKLNFPSTIMIFHTHCTLYVPVDALNY